MEREVFCSACHRLTANTFIECQQCPSTICICLNCFSKGREFGLHTSDHAYTIRSDDMLSVSNPEWTASEDMRLLSALAEHGFGNWTDVAQQMGTKSALECEKHYSGVYLTNHALETRSSRQEIALKSSVAHFRPCSQNQDDELSSVGYMAARGDFAIEHDNYAECDVKEVNFDWLERYAYEDRELFTELNLAVVDVYNKRLCERQRRKKIVQRYGLIDRSREVLRQNFSSEEKDLRSSLRSFCRLHSAERHEKFVQGLLHERELKSRIKQLQGQRSEGLRRKIDVDIYERRLKQRKFKLPSRKYMDELLPHVSSPIKCRLWLQREAAEVMKTMRRKKGCNVMNIGRI